MGSVVNLFLSSRCRPRRQVNPRLQTRLRQGGRPREASFAAARRRRIWIWPT